MKGESVDIYKIRSPFGLIDTVEMPAIIGRLILVDLYRLFPDVRGAPAIVEPDTVIRWHLRRGR
jgi:hypothetical protein